MKWLGDCISLKSAGVGDALFSADVGSWLPPERPTQGLCEKGPDGLRRVRHGNSGRVRRWGNRRIGRRLAVIGKVNRPDFKLMQSRGWVGLDFVSH